MPGETITAADYRRLLRDTKRLIEKSRQKPADGRIPAYWEIGDCIAQLKLSTDAGYGTSIVKDLARDLGLAPRTLYDAISFRKTFRAVPKKTSLSWSHYRVLCRVADASARRFYINRATEEHWSRRQLEAAIEQQLHLGDETLVCVLQRPDDPQFLYSATVLGVVDGDTVDLDVDLGFGVFRRLRTRLANLDAPELESQSGRAARDYLLAHLMSRRTIVVKTTRADLHGRYVAHIFTATQNISLAACFLSGTYLNDLLVQQGHATTL